MYYIYQLGRNVNVILSLLSLSLKRKVKCYNEYFFNEHVFHTEEYRQVERHITVMFVLIDGLLMSLKLTIIGS
jgi:ABC-type uncharacterized transport system permease subunit